MSKVAGQRWAACREGDPGCEPVVWSAVNWWLWVQPGDVIFIDEAQRVFRPMPSGRRVPMFMSKLETARHYGVEFIYATQHPQLLHSNVRNLVGPHEDVRRIFGSSRVMVYLWDRCSNPDRIAKATSRFWRHDRSAYSLYKSSELHTKFGQRMPLAVWGVLGGLALLAVTAFVLRDRLAARFAPPAPATTAPAKPSGGPVAGASPSRGGQGLARAPNVPSASFPVYDAEPVRLDREPLAARGVQLEGVYKVGGVTHATFGLVLDGQRIATASLAQLVAMGYAFTEVGPCAAVLRYRDTERVITCGKAQAVEEQRPDRQLARQADGGASAPM